MLPKINQPLFDLIIPSTQQKVSFRPYTVKEEKLLLIAQEDNEETTIIKAIMQIVNNCVVDPSFDCRKLATFDLEYAFLQIRAKSVNNIAKVSYRDVEDGKVYDFEIDLEKINVDIVPVDKNIDIGNNIFLTMKYPPAKIIEESKRFEDDVDLMSFFVISCIDSISVSEDMYLMDEFEYEEKLEWLDSLPVSAFERIKVFFENVPKLNYELTYTNENGNERKIVLDSIKDFFSWG